MQLNKLPTGIKYTILLYIIGHNIIGGYTA